MPDDVPDVSRFAFAKALEDMAPHRAPPPPGPVAQPGQLPVKPVIPVGQKSGDILEREMKRLKLTADLKRIQDALASL